MGFPEGNWYVTAWVTAPGDFPSPALQSVWVHAMDAAGAQHKVEQGNMLISGDMPIVVSVQRMDMWKPGVRP